MTPGQFVAGVGEGVGEGDAVGVGEGVGDGVGVGAGVAVGTGVGDGVAVGAGVGVAVGVGDGVGLGEAVPVAVGVGLGVGDPTVPSGTRVTVPTWLPFSVSWPFALTPTVTVAPADDAAPRTNATEREVAIPFAMAPVVFTLKLQGFTVIVSPTRRFPTVPVVAATAKMQEPKLSAPVAVLPPEAILNAGLATVPVNVTVVSPVVPNCETPDANVNGTFARAAVMVAFAASVVSDATPRAPVEPVAGAVVGATVVLGTASADGDPLESAESCCGVQAARMSRAAEAASRFT